MLPVTSAKSDPDSILVIEDEVVIRMLITDELRERGFTVIEACNADEAWAYLQSGGHANVVFSDVLMPGSMNGLELADKIRKQFPALPVILTSGYVGENGSRPMLGPFVQKPYNIDRAITVIHDVLASQ
jgi:CheY-like chemotaxis protein